jgi:pyruvate kinase
LFLQDFVEVEFKNSGFIHEGLSIHFPQIDFLNPDYGMTMSPLTEEDETEIIEFAIAEGFEFICLSNTRKVSDIEYLR